MEEQSLLLLTTTRVGRRSRQHGLFTSGAVRCVLNLWNYNLMKRDYHFSAETTSTAMGMNGAAMIIKSQIFHNPPLSLEECSALAMDGNANKSM